MSTEEYFGDWLKVIDKKELITAVGRINAIMKTKNIVPEYNDIFKAFTLCKLSDCIVVMVGQDPYPQKGIATGIPFGNKRDTSQISPSLQVIRDSVMNAPYSICNETFDITLESWARQGILMLNSALTCELGNPGTHTMLWRPFISSLIRSISNMSTGIVFMLFGETAQTFEPYIDCKKNYILKEKHPSYYARIGKDMPRSIFLECNSILDGMYGKTIEWYGK